MDSEKITYIKYCANVFLAKCEAQHKKGEIIIVQTNRGDLHECKVHNFICRTKDGGYAYSVTRTDGTNTATIAARRADCRRDWAQKAEERSSQNFEKAESAVAGIVPGQPVLVGHHSESAHRAAIDSSWRAMGHSVEESEKAKSHLSKADYWDRKAEDITLDMPESLEYFKEQLERAIEYHQGVKSGKYPREHAYTLTYAKKAVNELQKKVEIAERLWGES